MADADLLAKSHKVDGDNGDTSGTEPSFGAAALEKLERTPVMSMKDYDWASKELLGKGRCTNCAAVVKVRRVRDHKTVAIRVISSSILPPPEDSKRALDEAKKILALPYHTNLVRINAIFQVEAMYFLEMDFYETTLNSRIQKHFELRGAFPQTQVIRYLLQLTQAIRFLNDRDILHRDIKPKNIYLIPYGDLVKLGDYGAPKIFQNRSHASRYTSAFWWASKATRKSGYVHCCISSTSSWPYMPPETMCELFRAKTAVITHADHDQYTVKSEVWSLGVILYEMLVLKVPFHGRNPKLVQKAIMEATLPLTVIPAVRKYSTQLTDLIPKMICLVPEERIDLAKLEQKLEKLSQRADMLKLSSSGDSEALQKMLGKTKIVNPDVADLSGFTPLMRACALGHTDVAKVLLRQGASLTATSKTGLTVDDCIEMNTDEDERLVLRETIRSHLLNTDSSYWANTYSARRTRQT